MRIKPFDIKVGDAVYDVSRGEYAVGIIKKKRRDGSGCIYWWGPLQEEYNGSTDTWYTTSFVAKCWEAAKQLKGEFVQISE